MKIKPIVLFTCMVLATMSVSCLSDSGQEVVLNNYAGVAMVRNDSTYVVLRGGDVIYPKSGMNGVTDGDCFLLDFSIDYGLKENTDSGAIRGFLTADIKQRSPIVQYNLVIPLQDTLTILTGERAVTSILQYDAFIRDRLFLVTSHPADSLPRVFSLSGNNAMATDGTLDLYLRVYARTEQSTSSQPTTEYNAFNLESLGLSASGADSAFFRIHYAQGFQGDTAVTWGVSPVYRFALK
jgi:hypothetical protein